MLINITTSVGRRKKLARKRSGTKESGSPNPSFEFQLGSETDLKSNDPDALREEPSFEDSIDPGVDQDTDSSDQYDTDMEIVEGTITDQSFLSLMITFILYIATPRAFIVLNVRHKGTNTELTIYIHKLVTLI